jgi:hypothetical protein
LLKGPTELQWRNWCGQDDRVEDMTLFVD